MSRNYLSIDDELRQGDSLISNNMEWKFVFEPDGNLAVYGWKSVWTSDTAGIDAYRLCMQNDCNLVMYNKSGQAIWQSNSARGSGKMCRLCLTDEGKLQVYREGELIWTNDKP